MAKNWWGFEMPEAWLKTQEVLKNMTPVVSGLNVDTSRFSWQQDISGATAALRAMQPYLSGISAATETADVIRTFRIADIVVKNNSRLFKIVYFCGANNSSDP